MTMLPLREAPVSSSKLVTKDILKLWLPLASTWLLMAVEGPFLSAIVARMSDPELNLAAFGIAFSLALLFEAPVIMLMAAAAKLVRGLSSYRVVLKFSLILCAVSTMAMLCLTMPSVMDIWSRKWFGFDERLHEILRSSMVSLLVWPGMIGYRRFYQGVLIATRRNKRIVVGTFMRLGVMSACAFLTSRSNLLSGASVATLSLACGVVFEAIYARIAARSAIRELKSRQAEDGRSLSMSKVAKFYYPLALTSLIGLSIAPTLNFSMSWSAESLPSLTVLPVLNSLLFVFKAIPLSLQEVIITLLGDEEENMDILRKFCRGVGMVLFIVLGLISFTSLADLWLHQILGLKTALVHFARLPLQICVIIPAASMVLCWQRGVLIHRHLTLPVSHATAIEFVVVMGGLLIGIWQQSLPGVVIAACCLTLARASSVTYLKLKYRI